ncbi:MAG TPA: phage tail sheath family protein [Firmicutes bacterium]|nr:phage tail sheath family protein [Bacillota bacterium]
MAGGTFTSYTKVRPGAYINIKGADQNTYVSGVRGTMTMPMSLPWGAEGELVQISTEDLPELQSMIGLTTEDEGAQWIRLAFRNCTTAILYRMNQGGVKATVSTGGLQVTAKYPGSFGNRIRVAVETAEAAFQVVTYIDTAEKDRQTVSSAAELQGNTWVDFAAAEEEELVAAAAVSLTGGTDGEEEEDYTGYFAALQNIFFNTMAIPSTEETLKEEAVAFVRRLREEEGQKVQAVLINYPEADYEGILSVSQGFSDASETVDEKGFCVYAAGMTAGAELNESNTYHVIEGATKISSIPENLEKALRNGQLLLTYRQDGNVVVEKDINTLHTFTPEKTYTFSKNRVIRCLDDIANSVRKIFENKYIGKVNNDASGRSVFKGELVGYLNQLQGMGGIQNFSAADVTVTAGNDADTIIVDLAIQPVDALEKLYMTVTIA